MTSVEKFPPELVPDYTLPFGQVFQDYTRYVIENTGDLRILNCDRNELENFPSWVPDLRRNRMWTTEPHTSNAVSFSTDGQTLTVQGVRMGRVLLYFIMHERKRSELLMDLQEGILSLSASIRRVSLQDVFQEWIARLVENGRFPARFASEFRSIEDFLTRLPADSHHCLSDYDYHVDRLASSIFDYNYLVLETGDIVWFVDHCPPGSDDWVWAFKGSVHLHIISPHKNAYSLVGPCQLWANDVQLDDEFFSQRKLEQIDLI
jgi:hypothetical protein